MARFTMQQLEQLAVGQGPDADTYRNYDGIDTSQHLIWYQPTIYSRIMHVMEQGGALTRRQIADALGLKKTPWLVDRIDRLAAEGYLARIEARTPQGMIMWLYEVKR